MDLIYLKNKKKEWERLKKEFPNFVHHIVII